MKKPHPSFVYRASVIYVHDGDTVKLDVDLGRASRLADQTLGFHVYVEDGRLHMHENFRLADINAPELGNLDGSGVAARDYLIQLLGRTAAGGPYELLMIRTVAVAGVDAQEKYGRWLAHLWLASEDINKVPSINQRMVDSGHAVPFMVTGQ